MKEFAESMGREIEEARGRMGRDECELGVRSVVNNKKREIEGLQLELVEGVVRRLAEEKKKLFEVLDGIERNYLEKMRQYQQLKEMRSELMNYLEPFAKNSELFELKIHTSNNNGLTKFREDLFEL